MAEKTRVGADQRQRGHLGLNQPDAEPRNERASDRDAQYVRFASKWRWPTAPFEGAL